MGAAPSARMGRLSRKRLVSQGARHAAAAAVDIGARSEIHHRVRAIAASGQAVILVSSDLEEVEQVCDRAIVMERGQIRGILKGRSVTTSALLEAAYGVTVNG